MIYVYKYKLQYRNHDITWFGFYQGVYVCGGVVRKISKSFALKKTVTVKLQKWKMGPPMKESSDSEPTLSAQKNYNK